jgi:hypothetical protein
MLLLLYPRSVTQPCAAPYLLHYYDYFILRDKVTCRAALVQKVRKAQKSGDYVGLAHLVE